MLWPGILGLRELFARRLDRYPIVPQYPMPAIVTRAIPIVRQVDLGSLPLSPLTDALQNINPVSRLREVDVRLDVNPVNDIRIEGDISNSICMDNDAIRMSITKQLNLEEIRMRQRLTATDVKNLIVVAFKSSPNLLNS